MTMKFLEESVKAHNAKMREGAPQHMRRIMDEVDAAFGVENQRFDHEQKLRAWAKNLLGYSVNVSEIEDLNACLEQTKVGQPFHFKSTILVKTNIGNVDRVDRYLTVLEKTIIALTEGTKPTTDESGHLLVKYQISFPEVSFLGLIKLAFQRLFKRK